VIGDADDSTPEPPADDATPTRRPLHGRAGRRRLGRTLALQALYEADTSGHDPAVVVLRLCEDGGITGEPSEFAARLIAGIKTKRTELDALIANAAPQWPVGQLAVIDRNLLRVAIYELLFEVDTPVSVTVNEAVELAKTYGAEASPRFVNGVLGAVNATRAE